MFDRIKDFSIVYSFDRSGYERHAKHFEDIHDDFFHGKNYLITGGTSGIGEALAARLLRAGARVVVTGRSESKFEESSLPALGAEFGELDMADFHAVQNFSCAELDGVVCNAGGMPDNLTIIDGKYDLIFASQVIGHYVLIHHLINDGLLKAGSPIHLTSSGGMYPVKLSLDDLTWQKREYDKVKSYANAKRAQVILNQELPKLFPHHHFSCSHPGWVGTEALKEALPGFTQRLENRLRSADQGADTIYWCLYRHRDIAGGEFWFDRKARNVYPFFWTRESTETRHALLGMCQAAIRERDSAAA